MLNVSVCLSAMISRSLCRFATAVRVNPTTTTCIRITLVRLYAAKKGKKLKSPSVTLDPDLAEGLVDLEKLKNNMQSAMRTLQFELRDKINVKISPNALDKIKVESEDGKESFLLSQIANIKLNNSNLFVVDMSDSPQLTGHAAKAIKTWSPNFEPITSGHVISIPIPRVTQEYRENLVKVAKAACEQSKQNLRRVRQKGMSDIRKNKKGRSMDDVRTVEKMVQQLTDQFSEDADLLLEEKSKELLRK